MKMGSHLWLFLLGVSFALVIAQNTNKIDDDEIDRSKPMAFNPMYNKMLPLHKLGLETEKPMTETAPPTSEIKATTKVPSKIEEPKIQKIIRVNATKAPDTSKTTNFDTAYNYAEDDDELYDEDYYEYDESNEVNSTTPAPSAANTNKKTKTKGELHLIKGNEMDDVEEVPIKSENHIEDVDEKEDVIFSENVPCPRDCVCNRNLNSYLVATCNRLDADIQKFGSDITDLVVVDVRPKFPIILGPDFFVKVGLKHVSSVKIVNCTVEYIHPTAFQGLNELYSVNLTNVGLTNLHPDTFATNKGLRLLTISGNDLNFMTKKDTPYGRYMLKAPSVEELDLSNNNLRELLPTAFTQLENVVFINLAHNFLKALPEGLFDSVETIEELDLSFNSISFLPPYIFNRTALAILNLMYNEISNDLSFGTPDLERLDLSYCSIKHINNMMFSKMDGLIDLKLKGNSIRKIQPEAFISMRQLAHIDLSFNDLEQVSSLMFFKNSELEKIKLNDNPRLSQLPPDGFQVYTKHFNKVEYFDVSNCAIGAIGHNTFSTMPELVTLKMAWNNINNLDRGTFTALSRLVKLDLSNNLIIKLDELIFSRNHELSSINLAGNPIRRISAMHFSTINKLQELDVSECELSQLLSDPNYEAFKNFRFFSTLRSFNASSNSIRRISRNDVKWFKSLKSFDITFNPLKCNEDFLDLMTWLGKKGIVSGKVRMSESLDDSFAIASDAAQTWDQLAKEVCKHESHPEIQPRKEVPEVKVETPVEQPQKNDKKETEDAKKNDTEFNEDDADEDEDDEDEADDEDDDDENEEDDSEYDYDEDDDENVDQDAKDKKPIITDKGFIADEINVIKETEDKILRDKLLNKEEIVIERGTIYYSDYSFFWPILIMVSTAIIILIVVGKVVSCVMRKRGERYRQAILASKNNFVYKKLSEDIVTPQTPKVHRYAPINQV